MVTRFGVVAVGMMVPATIATVFGVLGYWSFGAMEENCYPAIQILIEVIKNHDEKIEPTEVDLKIYDFYCLFGTIPRSLRSVRRERLHDNAGLSVPSYDGDQSDVPRTLREIQHLFNQEHPDYTPRAKLPLWTWICVSEKCVPYRANQPLKLQSLETCNMLCYSIQIWPQPTGQVSLSKTAVPVQADLFQLETVKAPNRVVREHLTDVFKLFQQDLRLMRGSSRRQEVGCTVKAQITVNGSGDPRMLLDTDESYTLLLNPTNATLTLLLQITARSFCGARHALETLSQLLWLDRYEGHLLILQAATVKDAPKFRYRGLMIDTAHNYFPMSALLRTIDAMAASKLNTFHWHVSDSQAFSLQLSSVPELAQFGAYSQRDVYTIDQVRAMVRRARLRGIRILIEVDTPAHVGHAWNWGTTEFGDLVHCVNPKPWSAYCTTPPCGQLDPNNSHVFEILRRVYKEIIQLTGVDDLFHLGGSDISERCWTEKFKDTDPTDLWIKFTKTALQILESINGSLPNLTLLWTSRLSEGLQTDFVRYVHALGLQTRNVALPDRYERGIRTVLSHQDFWDLNSGFGEWYEPNGGSPYNSWQSVYGHRPWLWVPNNMGVVEGGEATVWSWGLCVGELDARIWPRAAALGDRLWTDRAEGATQTVYAGLDIHRTRLINRGVKAAPIWSNWCTQNPYTCYWTR
ncbi:Hexosaminidase [Operophtera brumata]|uniref:Chitooligosaccharidolytic beta-N-acetylglucosaminidase n=1 Tax=Operophtera brumata TaxID=104452 RepID=A0A0L7LKV0_OPEBR|nr:Hexosaminidase [Operophtera brumata]